MLRLDLACSGGGGISRISGRLGPRRDPSGRDREDHGTDLAVGHLNTDWDCFVLYDSVREKVLTVTNTDITVPSEVRDLILFVLQLLMAIESD